MDEDKDTALTIEVSQNLSRARTKKELGEILSTEITRYMLQDLQVIGGRLHTELIRPPQN